MVFELVGGQPGRHGGVDAVGVVHEVIEIGSINEGARREGCEVSGRQRVELGVDVLGDGGGVDSVQIAKEASGE